MSCQKFVYVVQETGRPVTKIPKNQERRFSMEISDAKNIQSWKVYENSDWSSGELELGNIWA